VDVHLGIQQTAGPPHHVLGPAHGPGLSTHLHG